MGTLFEGKVIFDKTYGHVAYGCAACCGWVGPAKMWYDPLGILVSSTAGQGANLYSNCDALWEDVSSFYYGSWSPANTSIATADYYGTHTGVAVGSTTSSISARLNNAYYRATCPITGIGGSGGDNVKPKVVIQGNRTHVYISSDSTVIQNNALYSQGTPSGGTYTWSTPDSTTSFDNVNAQDPHVKATNYTGQTNDTQLTVNYSYNGVAATPASIRVTKLIFERLCCDSVIQVASYNGQIYNGQTTYGYIFQASYNVIANPGSVQVSDASGVDLPPVFGPVIS